MSTALARAGRGPLRLGVLASGSGTNLQALLDAGAGDAADGLDGGAHRRLDAQVALVISNVAGARCLTRAATVGVPHKLLAHQTFSSREAYDQALVAELKAHGVELVCLAGFMRLVTPVLLRAFPDRVLNIHPSLLPAFPGLHAVRQALEAGARITGCTVHFVDEGTDTGPVLIQSAVPVLDGDTEETLANRIHAQEHPSYVRAVQLVASGAVLIVEGKRRRVQLAEPGLPRESALSLSSPPLEPLSAAAAGGPP